MVEQHVTSNNMIAKTLRSNLMALATAYAKATKTTLPQVSKKFYGHINFFEEFKTGARSISIDKYEQVVEAIRDHWPPETEWPYLAAVIIPSLKRRG